LIGIPAKQPAKPASFQKDELNCNGPIIHESLGLYNIAYNRTTVRFDAQGDYSSDSTTRFRG